MPHRRRQRHVEHRSRRAGVEEGLQLLRIGGVGGDEPRARGERVNRVRGDSGRLEAAADEPLPLLVALRRARRPDQRQLQIARQLGHPAQARQQQPLGEVAARAENRDAPLFAPQRPGRGDADLLRHGVSLVAVMSRESRYATSAGPQPEARRG